MGKEQYRCLDYATLIKKCKEDFDINIGKYIKVPAVNGRKQKKRTGDAVVIGITSKQSGEIIILVRQGNKRLQFTMDELLAFWSKHLL